MSKLGSGTKDFIIIRVCAVLILLYSIYLTAFFISTNGVNYKVWSAFFQSPLNKISTSVFFIAFAISNNYIINQTSINSPLSF